MPASFGVVMVVTATSGAASKDFADVYRDQVDGVWRFVRSRVPTHHDAHDVTADAFVRAWRAWDRFDAARGAVEPWLFTIARRTVADWWRRQQRQPVEPVETLEAADPAAIEDGLLHSEVLAGLAVALGGLSQRERDALALRFAAQLSMRHIGQVLDVTADAAKMIVHRAIQRLRGTDLDSQPAPRSQTGADLEAVIDDVLARGHEVMSQSELHGLLVHLAAVHQPPTPPDLPGHIAFCIRCAVRGDPDDQDKGRPGGAAHGSASRRLTRANIASALLAFTGVCLLCTVPALQTLVWSLGVAAAAYYVHLVGIALAPVVAWLVYRGRRAHGRSRGFRLARAGAILLAVHIATHILFEVVPQPPDVAWARITGGIAFTLSDMAGTGLLVAGAVQNLVDTHRWRTAQSIRLRHALTPG